MSDPGFCPKHGLENDACCECDDELLAKLRAEATLYRDLCDEAQAQSKEARARQTARENEALVLIEEVNHLTRRVAVLEAALRGCRYELRNYERDDLGCKRQEVIDAIADADRALDGEGT